MATPTSLPASFSAGNVLTASQMNDLRGAFRVLKVVTSDTSTVQTTSGTTFVDSGLSAAITPSATSSKILVVAFVGGGKVAAINTGIAARLVRGSTALTTFSQYHGYTSASNDTNFFLGSVIWLDSPATTSSTTYKVQFARNAGSGTVEVQNNSTTSTICLMEISA